jgi:small-conductance mechanosensitive channel
MSKVAPELLAIWIGRTLLALAATFLLGWLLRRLGTLVASLTNRIEEKLEATHLVAVQKVELVSRSSLLRFAAAVLRFLRWAVSLVAVYLWLLACAWALDKSGRVFGAIVEPLILAISRIGTAILEYSPNIVWLLAIAGVARFATKVIDLFANAIEEGRIAFPWLAADLAQPTKRLALIAIWILALIMAMPYLPGSESKAFQGVSIVLGILVSLGSTSATSNLIGGLVITYSRAYREGDRVKIGEVVGDVIALGAFTTRIRTIKDEEAIIPNGVVQAGTVLNFSRFTAETGVQVASQVTISYDTEWRVVHRLLIEAAKLVDGVLEAPEPYVLQRALDDFYVRYEICAFTDRANELHLVQARLNQSIQDTFFQGGVEICSPHFEAKRDGASPAVPKSRLGVVPTVQSEPFLRPLPAPREKSRVPEERRTSLRPTSMRPASMRPPPRS